MNSLFPKKLLLGIDRIYLDAPQERIEVYFVSGPIVQIGAITIPPMFLVICKEVFSTRLYTYALHTHDRFVCAFPVEIRIWAKTITVRQKRQLSRKAHLPFPSATTFGITHLFRGLRDSYLNFQKNRPTISNAGPKYTLFKLNKPVIE